IPQGHPRWALVRSVSKSLGPDLRVGIVGSDTLTASRLNTHIRSGAMWVSHLLQRLTYRLATNPQTPAKLAYAGAAYADANAQFVSALAAETVSAISDDGVNAWITLRTIASPIVEALGTRGWLVRDGAEFSLAHTDDAVEHIRVPIHHLSSEQVDHFVADLAAVLAQEQP